MCHVGSCVHPGPNGVTLLSMLLKRMALWMANAAAYLQRCHQVMQQHSAGVAHMEGLDAGQELNSIAQARQALQVCSHLFPSGAAGPCALM